MAVGRSGARAATLPEASQRSEDADTSRAPASPRTTCHQATATGAADEPVLADQRSGPASGVAGDRGDGLGDEPRGTAGRKRSGPQAVKRARSRAAGRKTSPRSPGTGRAASTRAQPPPSTLVGIFAAHATSDVHGYPAVMSSTLTGCPRHRSSGAGAATLVRRAVALPPR